MRTEVYDNNICNQSGCKLPEPTIFIYKVFLVEFELSPLWKKVHNLWIPLIALAQSISQTILHQLDNYALSLIVCWQIWLQYHWTLTTDKGEKSAFYMVVCFSLFVITMHLKISNKHHTRAFILFPSKLIYDDDNLWYSSVFRCASPRKTGQTTHHKFVKYHSTCNR